MAAYQCLNCHQIEDGDEACCDAPDLFCINDMPGEIVKLRAALAQQAEPTVKESLPVESVVAENATTQQQIEQTPPSEYRRGYWAGFAIGKREGRIEAEDELAQQAEPVERRVALAEQLQMQQAEPLTIERLRDALVASRIIQPAAVEDPEEYDDGVTLHRIEALHRRIT